MMRLRRGQRRAQIIGMAKAGYSARVIADSLGVHHQNVYTILKKAGVPLPELPWLADRKRIVMLAYEGKTVRQISDEVGLGADSVRNHLHRSGVRLPKPPRKRKPPKGPPRPPWPDHETEELKALWRAGHSIGQCATKMGKSRGAIAGKLDRLGLLTRTRRPEDFRHTIGVEHYY